APVHPRVAEDRVLAHAEAGRQPCAVDGSTEQCLADAFAVLVEIFDFAVLRLEAVELQSTSSDGDRGVRDLSLMGDTALFRVVALEQRVELIAGMYVALEIDIVAEAADEIDHHARRHP